MTAASFYSTVFVISQVEGTCSGTYGFMLMVTEIMGIGQGKIREGTGSATFHVEYTCLVFRPFKGEVLDAVVASVNKVGSHELQDACNVILSHAAADADIIFECCRWGFLLMLGPCKSLCHSI